jgi:hypothetical protein
MNRGKTRRLAAVENQTETHPRKEEAPLRPGPTTAEGARKFPLSLTIPTTGRYSVVSGL